MTTHAAIVKIFIASPSDLSDESKICVAVIERLNKDPFLPDAIALRAFSWDDPSAPLPLLASLTPWEAVNRGLLRPADSDVFVALFWARMGTPLPFPKYKKQDHTQFLSGTEWELNDALDAWEKRGTPEILIYRCTRLAQDTSQLAFVEQLLKDLGLGGRRPLPGLPNSFADAEDFRFQFDYHLRIVLRQIIGVDSLRSHSVPVALPLTERTPSMNLLIAQFDNCNVVNGRLQPCKYHEDRLEVEFYEQPDRNGENDIDQKRVELTPTNSLITLFEKMQHKRMPAGGWGLMACHREWLIDHLVPILRPADGKPSPVSILQLGTASPMHYFATARLLANAAHRANRPPASPITFYTYDRCLTPVASVRSLLLNLTKTGRGRSSSRQWASIAALGMRRTLDPSVYDIGAESDDMRQRIEHHIEVWDICSAEGFLEGPAMFDVAIAHFTFSMWREDCDSLCAAALTNLAKALKPGASVLVALSELHNPSISDVNYYHEKFAEAGFSLANETRAWDVYDLTFEERQRFLTDRKRFTSDKRVVLAEYRVENSQRST